MHYINFLSAVIQNKMLQYKFSFCLIFLFSLEPCKPEIQFKDI